MIHVVLPNGSFIYTLIFLCLFCYILVSFKTYIMLQVDRINFWKSDFWLIVIDRFSGKEQPNLSLKVEERRKRNIVLEIKCIYHVFTGV